MCEARQAVLRLACVWEVFQAATADYLVRGTTTHDLGEPEAIQWTFLIKLWDWCSTV
jgi:hypothetical protein